MHVFRVPAYVCVAYNGHDCAKGVVVFLRTQIPHTF